MNLRGAILGLLWSVAGFGGLALAADAGVLPAGEFSNTELGANAFSIPYAGLSKKQARKFAKGHEQFNEPWVVAPDPYGVWGLGPTFNEDRCVRCHANNGRGETPMSGDEAARGTLVRLSVPGRAPNGGPQPHAIYGQQIQTRGIEGRVPAEGGIRFDYVEHSVSLADGDRVQLRKPRIIFDALQFGELGKDVMYSPRLAQQVIGLGLLEAVPEASLLELAESQQAAGVVSGRPNYVFDVETERTVLGRFGWKAGQPNLRQQTASAFMFDIGATTYLFPDENCPQAQTQCRDLPSAARCGGQGGCGHTNRPEVVPSRLTNITLYLRSLTVPARRNREDAQIQHGEQLFESAGCAACHVPTLLTGEDVFTAAATNQVIHPYTDLLLHDMGPGLADGRPEFEASGTEWRTPPLWGIGLLEVINGNAALLHDGRARNFAEAILWHGGEAQSSRNAFAEMSRENRNALTAFLGSL